MSRRVKRATKVPSAFKDFVSSDVQEKPMVEEEHWYLVQFEDEGQLYSLLSPSKVNHISPADMNEPIEEGDYVDAEWPADGRSYDAKVVKIGPKAELRKLRTQLEKGRVGKEKGTKGKETRTVTKPDAALTSKVLAKDCADKDKDKKKKKREENKQKRLEVERKRKAEQEQAKENARYFSVQIDSPLPIYVSPDKSSILQPLTFSVPSNETPLQQNKTSIPCVPKRSLLPSYSSLKKPRLSFNSEPESTCFSSGDESDDHHAEVNLHDQSRAVQCHRCPTLQKNVVELEAKIEQLRRKLKETRKLLQEKECENAENIKRTIDQAGDQAEMVAGVISPEMAKKSRMVPLVPGSSVYLHQEQKNSCFSAKPTILVRNLMRVFFKDDVLKMSNYGGGGPRGYKKLDPAITAAIIGHAMDLNVIKAENRVHQGRLTETINKMCNEARRGVSKLQPNQ